MAAIEQEKTVNILPPDIRLGLTGGAFVALLDASSAAFLPDFTAAADY